MNLNLEHKSINRMVKKKKKKRKSV